jgi:hypothetical protein
MWLGKEIIKNGHKILRLSPGTPCATAAKTSPPGSKAWVRHHGCGPPGSQSDTLESLEWTLLATLRECTGTSRQTARIVFYLARPLRATPASWDILSLGVSLALFRGFLASSAYPCPSATQSSAPSITSGRRPDRGGAPATSEGGQAPLIKDRTSAESTTTS